MATAPSFVLICSVGLAFTACNSKKNNNQGVSQEANASPQAQTEVPQTQPEDGDLNISGNNQNSQVDGALEEQRRRREQSQQSFYYDYTQSNVDGQQAYLNRNRSQNSQVDGALEEQRRQQEQSQQSFYYDYTQSDIDGRQAYLDRIQEDINNTTSEILMYGDITSQGVQTKRFPELFYCNDIVQHPDRTQTPDPQIYTCCSNPNYFGYRVAKLYENQSDVKVYSCPVEGRLIKKEFCSIPKNSACTEIDLSKSQNVLSTKVIDNSNTDEKSVEIIEQGIEENPIGLALALHELNIVEFRIFNHYSNYYNSSLSGNTMTVRGSGYNQALVPMSMAAYTDYSYLLSLLPLSFDITFDPDGHPTINFMGEELKDSMATMFENIDAINRNLERMNQQVSNIDSAYGFTEILITGHDRNDEVKARFTRSRTSIIFSQENIKDLLVDGYDSYTRPSSIYFSNIVLGSYEKTYVIHPSVNSEVTVEVDFKKDYEGEIDRSKYTVSITASDMFRAFKVNKFEMDFNEEFKIIGPGKNVYFRYRQGLHDRVNFQLSFDQVSDTIVSLFSFSLLNSSTGAIRDFQLID